MTLERAKELLDIQINLVGGYNRNAARIILSEVQSTLGKPTVNQLIREMNLEEAFGFKEGQSFEN